MLIVLFRFVVGYGMDFNEAFRDLRHLAVINEVSQSIYYTHCAS